MLSKITTFEDIVIWQKAKSLSLSIYSLFTKCKDSSFKDQIQRASISICNNIAEGYERSGNREFVKFLYIAKGSSAEVRSLLYFALELKYITQAQFDSLYLQSKDISRMLSGFIKTLQP